MREDHLEELFDLDDDQALKEAYQKAVNNLPVSDDFYNRTLIRMEKAALEQKTKKVIPIRRITAVAASFVLVLGMGTAGYFYLEEANMNISAPPPASQNAGDSSPLLGDEFIMPTPSDRKDSSQNGDSHSGQLSDSGQQGTQSSGENHKTENSQAQQPAEESKKENGIISFFKSIFSSDSKKTSDEKKTESGSESQKESSSSHNNDDTVSDKVETAEKPVDPVTQGKDKDNSKGDTTSSQQQKDPAKEQTEESSGTTSQQETQSGNAQTLAVPEAGVATKIAPGVTPENADLAWTQVAGSVSTQNRTTIQSNLIYQNNLFDIPKELQEYVGVDKVNEWNQQFCNMVNGNPIWKYRYYNRFNADYTANEDLLQCSLWGFVHTFQIPKEELVKIYQATDQRPYGYQFELDTNAKRYEKYHCYLTDAQIDALYSENPSDVMKAFVGYEAVYHNGDIYLYQWFETHSAEDYQKAGFTVEQIQALTDQLTKNKVSVDGIPNKFNLAYISDQCSKLKTLSAEK
ncbi:MAG: hypothetical protein ACOX60_03900 [Massiliimalia sp.]|jgi:hypothetical protein